MIAESRVGSYSLIAAIETDLRLLIEKYISAYAKGSDFLGSYEDKCIKRFRKETGDTQHSNRDLIAFLDFQDAFTLLLQKADYLPLELTREIKRLAPQLEKIATIRNRVMHVRPMEFDDYFIVSNFAKEVPSSEHLDWHHLKSTLNEITDNPSRLSQVEIPFEEKTLSISHNLPNPDFDETGFIGRAEEIAEIKRRLSGNNKVVTIIGDGGIGKSALALKVAYELLDETNPVYDSIVWVEAKKNILTESGVVAIRDNITPIKIIEDINAQYFPVESGDLITETIENLKEYKTLLIIDNLETILSDTIRRFIREASLHASILITSRIGLGELEYRVEISGLKPLEAARLLRQYGQIKGVKSIAEIDNNIAKEIVGELHFNPLAIRWYVYSVAAGKSPTMLTQNQSELLSFCLGNVYEHLDSEEKCILEVCLSHRGETISEAEIYYLVESSAITTKTAISRLLSTTFLKLSFKKTASGLECHYNIPEFAKQYLVDKRVVGAARYKEIQEKINQLTWNSAKIATFKESDVYEIHFIEANTSSEKISAKILFDALKLSRRDKQDPRIIPLLLEAQRYTPGYIDVYKVSGFIRSEMGDYLGAEEDYKAGLQIDPCSKKLLYFYSGFLLMHVTDSKNALLQIEKLVSIDGQSIEPRLLLCRCLAENGKLDQAIELVRAIAISNNIPNAKIRRSSLMLLMNLLNRRSHYEFTTLHDNNASFATLTEGMQVFRHAHEMGDADELIIRSAEKIIRELKNCSLRSGNPEKVKRSLAESEFYNEVVAARITFNNFAQEKLSEKLITSIAPTQDLATHRATIDPDSICVGDLMEGSIVSVGQNISIAFGNKIYGTIPKKWLQHKGHNNREDLAPNSRIKGVVKKIKINPDKTANLTLSRLELLDNPWDRVFEKHAVGDELEGIIVNIIDFGAFIEFESGFIALIHRSDISWYDAWPNVSTFLQVGVVAKVVITSIHSSEQKMGASIRALTENPWNVISDIAPVGSIFNAKVIYISNNNATVRLENNFYGKFPLSKNNSVAVSEVVQARVVGYDLERRIINLSQC